MLEKAKDPRVNITKREKAFNTAYEDELKRASKILKGKPEAPVIKPKMDLKEPIENLEK